MATTSEHDLCKHCNFSRFFLSFEDKNLMSLPKKLTKRNLPVFQVQPVLHPSPYRPEAASPVVVYFQVVPIATGSISVEITPYMCQERCLYEAQLKGTKFGTHKE